MTRIDTHHHLVPPEYATWLSEKGVLAGGLPIPDWDPQSSLALMDCHDIAAAVLSVSMPGVHLGDGSDARAMARHVNEFAAQVVRDYPGRFGFFATLPLPDVDGALEELAFCFDRLGADGVILLANHRGTYLGDPAFDPVFDELQRRRAVVFVHPTTVPGLDPLPGIAPFIADFLLDTTRAAVNLARSGTLERLPDVPMILAHAGGFLPYAAYRLAAAASAKEDYLHGLGLLGSFYFDVALSSTPSALPALLAFAQPGHVTFGTDFPYAPDYAVAGMVGLYDSVDLDAGVRDSIDHGASASMFPRLTVVGRE